MKRAIFFVLLINVSLLSFSQNLVINPGFESWEKTTKPGGWTTAQSCLKDSVNINSGSYSCRQDGGTKYLGQTFSIVAGKKYRLSFFYKTSVTGSGNGCRIWCYWKDGSGNNLPDVSTDDILRPSKYLKSETMQQFTADITAPSTASSFYLEVRTYANSVAWFDDFMYEENLTTVFPEQNFRESEIFPNPANDYLIITNIFNVKHIDIQNLAGTILWSSGLSGDEIVTVPVSSLTSGIYVIRLLTSEELIVRKFIKE
jgi:hypothetical protein